MHTPPRSQSQVNALSTYLHMYFDLYTLYSRWMHSYFVLQHASPLLFPHMFGFSFQWRIPELRRVRSQQWCQCASGEVEFLMRKLLTTSEVCSQSTAKVTLWYSMRVCICQLIALIPPQTGSASLSFLICLYHIGSSFLHPLTLAHPPIFLFQIHTLSPSLSVVHTLIHQEVCVCVSLIWLSVLQSLW